MISIIIKENITVNRQNWLIAHPYSRLESVSVTVLVDKTSSTILNDTIIIINCKTCYTYCFSLTLFVSCSLARDAGLAALTMSGSTEYCRNGVMVKPLFCWNTHGFAKTHALHYEVLFKMFRAEHRA